MVLYNFELTSIQFDTYERSFFLDDETSQSMLENILTMSMNKLVNRSIQGFCKDVMDGIIQGCLFSPHFTLKELLSQASKHGGYEKVVCEVQI